MSLVDSHCHLDMVAQDLDLSAVMEDVKANDISHLLTISTSVKTFPDVHKIALRYPFVHCSFGVHPHNEFDETLTLDEILYHAAKEKVVAIGETGLDYYYNNDHMISQQHNFRLHIQAANQLNKPLIIHTRHAKEDTLAILREENADKCGGVLHCFTEDWDMAKQALDFGFYISISGIVTFKKAENVQEVAKKIPLDRLLVETDSPYLSPVPFRGKTNTPARVRVIAEYIAQLRGIPYEHLAEKTTENFFQLFNEVPA